MRLRRLQALRDRMTASQQQALDDLVARHQTIRKDWQLHYGQKMLREAKSRLDTMEHFFDECNHDPRSCVGGYKPEALRRTIVQEIAGAAQELSLETGELKEKMRHADAMLRRYAQPDGFLWDRILEPVYPQDTFSWLWALPQLNK
jgi:hypothetical protein